MLASPLTGTSPFDSKSDTPDAQTSYPRRFNGNSAPRQAFATTQNHSSLDLNFFDAVAKAGVSGQLSDLNHEATSARELLRFANGSGPTAGACRAGAILRRAMGTNDKPLNVGWLDSGFNNAKAA